jgi:carboxypeptidase C (cathepsin A)
VKAYSGFINLPPTLTGENFTISTFYWFFETRKNPAKAPFAIYLSGGPGESSMDGVTGDGGPCNINADSISTSLNPWSFNNEVNMIYIDQPVQTGFSYDTLVNGTYDLIANVITPREFSPDVEVNETTIWGTFPSQDPTKTTLGSERGASALWHFMQVFVAEYVFPLYTVSLY